jgi:NADH:ubiquinone oxidoreductase subunit 4 (subunit M)
VKLFDKNRYVVRFISYLLILIGFGVVFPLLAIIVLIATIIRTVYEEMLLGRILLEAKQKNISWCEETLKIDCQGFLQPMRYALPVIIPIATLLYSYLLFDIWG